MFIIVISTCSCTLLTVNHFIHHLISLCIITRLHVCRSIPVSLEHLLPPSPITCLQSCSPLDLGLYSLRLFTVHVVIFCYYANVTYKLLYWYNVVTPACIFFNATGTYLALLYNYNYVYIAK